MNKLTRIENPGFAELLGKLNAGAFERVFLAEGDSWFDIFTPAPLVQPNLLDAIRTPWHAAVVDISQIGDTALDVATPPQSTHTKALLDTFDFNALFLSVGGNDLIEVFKDAFMRAIAQNAIDPEAPPPEAIAATRDPEGVRDVFDSTLDHVEAWVGLRNRSRKNRTTPILVHGYDYLQPRPAGARIIIGGAVVGGPWIYPVLQQAGYDSAQMRELAHEVVDTFNDELQARIAGLPNVRYVNTREVLALADPDSEGPSNDWMDEIHPTPQGFDKLATQRWNEAIQEVA